MIYDDGKRRRKKKKDEERRRNMKKKGVTSVFDSIERVEFREFFGVRSNPQINKGVAFSEAFRAFFCVFFVF